MGNPVATKNADFMCFAFPDICKTQVGPNDVPIPYPNTGYLSDAVDIAVNVFVNGDPIILEGSKIPDKKTTGDEAGSLGSIKGSKPGSIQGEVEFTSFSNSVFVHDKGVVRMFDTTMQNFGNATGYVLSGVTNVLVGD